MNKVFISCRRIKKAGILALLCGIWLCGCANTQTAEKTDSFDASAQTASASTVPISDEDTDTSAQTTPAASVSDEDSDASIKTISATTAPVSDEDSDSDFSIGSWEDMWEVEEVTQTEVKVYPLFYGAIDVGIDICQEELSLYDVIEINFDGDIMETFPAQLSGVRSIKKLSEDKIQELAASNWKNEEMGEGSVIYAIVAELTEYKGIKSALVNELQKHNYIKRARIPKEMFTMDEEVKAGDIIRIKCRKMVDDEEKNEYSFDEIYSISKIR